MSKTNNPHSLSNAMHNGLQRPLPSKEEFAEAARLMMEAIARAKRLRG